MAEKPGLKVEEIHAKNLLVKSKLADYCVNPYSGCQHACAYCYVPAMPWNHDKAANWGKWVGVKINAAEVLEKELKKAKKGNVMLCSATDGWQPIEAHYKITRNCLEALVEADWPITVLTKSGLVLRDIDLLKRFNNTTVGLTITTDKEDVARIIEPYASSPSKRIEALAELKQAGLKTYAFIGPMLPMNAENLAEKLVGKIDFAFIDRLNYAGKNLALLLEENNLSECTSPEWIENKKNELKKELEAKGIEVRLLL